MFKEAPLTRCLRIAFGTSVTGLALAVTPAFAQSTDTTDQKLERVEITGSSIKRIDAESALPVQVITRKDIEKTGATSTEDLLRTLTAASGTGSLSAAAAAGSSSTSVSTISLRGLAGPRTLILIDGRRTAVYGGVPGGGGDGAVDVNSIPINAIERIEVLKDGASAIYGSDAIAGVINFILRKDFTGGEVTAGYGDSAHGGGRTERLSAIVGFGDLQKDKFNVTIDAGITKQDFLFGYQRPNGGNDSTINLTTGLDETSGNVSPGNVAYGPTYNHYANPAYPNCAPSVVDPFQNPANKRCRYDYGPLVTLVPQTDFRNVLLNGHLAIGADSELYFQGSATQNTSKTTIQPVPLSDQFAVPTNNAYNAYLTNLTNTYVGEGLMTLGQQAALVGNPAGSAPTAAILIPASSPYYPAAFMASIGMAGDPADVRYRNFTSGPRRLEDDANSSRVVVGGKTTVAGWDLDAGLLMVQQTTKEKVLGGFPEYSKLLPLFDEGLVNPFGSTSGAGLTLANQANFTGEAYESTTKLSSLDLKGSKDVLQLPAGTLSVAGGLEARTEKYDFSASSEIQTGDVSGYGGNFLGLSKQRNVQSAFLEAAIPILPKFDGDVAVRWDDYQNVGSTVNPKASLRWQPTPQILLRGSIGTGFRAPSLGDLYSPQVQGVTGNVTDPLRCPYTASNNDCGTQDKEITGGNPNLTPEKSTNATFGIVLEPTKNLSVALDYFEIKMRNEITSGGLDPASVILVNAASAEKYSYLVTRGPTDCTSVPGMCIPGPIESIQETNLNLNKVHIKGLDLDAKWRILTDGADKLTLNFTGTYYLKYDVQNLDGSYSGVINSGAGAIIANGVLARWKHEAVLTWDHGPYSVSFTDNYQTSYTDLFGDRTVGPYETFDLQAQYTGFKGLTLTGGIRNLMDRAPPLTESAGTGQFQQGYDISYANPLDRFFYMTASWKFK